MYCEGSILPLFLGCAPAALHGNSRATALLVATRREDYTRRGSRSLGKGQASGQTEAVIKVVVKLPSRQWLTIGVLVLQIYDFLL
jgi:hypothetical protein